MSQPSSAGLAVRQQIVVAAPQQRAFEVFTRDLGKWWPLEGKQIGAQPAETAVMDEHAGGRWYECAADGSECPWGRVLVWEPPHRVVLSWEISAAWQPDPSITSEVEVRFVPEGDDRTRVELEHRGLESYGEQADAMRDLFDSEGAWDAILAALGARVAAVG